MEKTGLPARLDLSLPKAAHVLSNGLILRDGLGYDEWSEVGMTLKQATKSLPWWVGDWLNYGEREYGEKYTQALEATDYEYDALAHCKWVAERFSEQDERGEFWRRRQNLSWSHHREVAALEPEEQDEMLDAAEAGEWTCKELRQAVRAYKRELQTPKEPTGKFRVFYADPPWQYRDTLGDSSLGAEHHYPTMSVEELSELPVAMWAEADAVLFMWATSPVLEDAFPVLHAWGFEYKASFVWDKGKHVWGHYNSVQHEFLLIAIRGSCVPAKDAADSIRSIVAVERIGRHSEKPEEFRDIIDAMYPEGRRIEVFARQEVPEREGRPVWEVWGNEVECLSTG